MNRDFKTFLLWLLLFALPVQGFAAAVRLSCGSEHHTDLPTAAKTAQDIHHHHHEFQNQTVQDAASTDFPAAQLDDYESSYCSACAACCAGAVVPPSIVDWSPFFSSSFSPVTSSASSFTGHIPAGLERPPRHILVQIG